MSDRIGGRAEAVSWLIPVRNARTTLAAAVESALAECAADDEVIVVDDGSTDRPDEVLPADPRVRMIASPPRGIAPALELGRAAARGALIARLDADDVALPGRIAAQRALFAADDAIAAVGGRVRITDDPAAEPAGGMAAYVEWINTLPDPMRELYVESPLVHPATTIRKSALDRVGGWRDGDFPEDYDLWLRLAAAGGRLAKVEVPVVLWRDRPDRLTRTDPRYRREAFDRLKLEHLHQRVLGPAPAATCPLVRPRRRAPLARCVRARGA